MKILLWFICFGALPGLLRAQDPGMEPIGILEVALIFATNDDPAVAGGATRELSEEEEARLHAIGKLDFKEYRLMGRDRPELLKGYENWATPLRPSKEILVSFQPIKRSGDDRVQIVLEYWQSKRKIFSVNPTLTVGKTLYLLGPEWRKGRMVLAIKVDPLKP